MDNSYSVAEIRDFLNSYYGKWVQGADGAARMSVPRLLIEPYAYTLTFTGLAQAGTSTQQLPITANADFLYLATSHRANIAAAQTVSGKTAPFARLMLIDSGSGNQFMQTAVDLENYSQNGSFGRTLPFPRLLSGRSAITATLTSYAPTAETYSVDITLEGVNVRLMD